jgi:hypothetical protein
VGKEKGRKFLNEELSVTRHLHCVYNPNHVRLLLLFGLAPKHFVPAPRQLDRGGQSYVDGPLGPFCFVPSLAKIAKIVGKRNGQFQVDVVISETCFKHFISTPDSKETAIGWLQFQLKSKPFRETCAPAFIGSPSPSSLLHYAIPTTADLCRD